MNTPRYSRLPNTVFRFRVPMICTLSQWERDEHYYYQNIYDGVPDRNTWRQLTDVYLPLDRVIDIVAEGMPVYLSDPNDLVTIYQILEDYLNDTQARNTDNLNRPKNEDKRLFEIDKFAQQIFDTYRYGIFQNKLQNYRNPWSISSLGTVSTQATISTVSQPKATTGASVYTAGGNTAPKIDKPKISMPKMGIGDKYVYEPQPKPTVLEQPDHIKRNNDISAIHNGAPQVDFSKFKRKPVYDFDPNINDNK